MGIIGNKEVIRNKALKADFLKAFNNGENPANISQFLMTVQSNSNNESYGWLGQVPQMEQWVSERKLRGLNDFEYTIENKTYETTLQVNREDMEDDQLGAVQARIRDLAGRARTHELKLFYDLLINGATDLAYDGQAYFSTTHSEGDSGTQSNLLTGTGTTAAQFKTDFIAARAAMRKYLDDQGEPMNEGEMQLYVVCPPDLEGVVDEVLIANELSSTTNTLKGAAKKLVSSRLADVNDWYLINSAGELKPVIKQVRRAISFEENTGNKFMRNEIHYGVDYRIGMGYGLWQKAIKTTNA